MSSTAEWYRDDLLKWGLNFHWHAWEPVGARYDAEAFATQLRHGGVPTVSLEAKCALGWTYYPSRYGIVHPALQREGGDVFDYFGDRVRVVKAGGGRVIAYFCVGMEGPLLHEHPDWRWYPASSWNAESQEHVLPPHQANTWELTSLFSPYVDEHLLPQLGELVERYPIDVLWLDIFLADKGVPDYNPFARERFRADTGGDLPPLTEETNVREVAAYFRREGRRVRQRICDHARDIARRVGRELLVGVNWAHAATAPTPRGSSETPLDVDILTCDVVQEVCGNPYEIGLHARYFSALGRPSDVISTNFRWWGEWDMKPVDVLCREAAIAIANGSTYYVYDYAYPDGRLDPGRVEHVRRLGVWVGAREDVFRRTARAHATRPHAEIAVLVSTQTHEEATPEYWLRECFEAIEGASRLLQTTARSFRLCDESSLAAHLATCRLLILADVAVVSEATAEQIGAWAAAGGKVLIAGPVPPPLADRWGIRTDPRAGAAFTTGGAYEPLAEFTGAKDPQRTEHGYLDAVGTRSDGFEPVPLVVWGRFFPFDPGEAEIVLHYRPPGVRAAAETAYGAIMGYSAPGEETVPGAVLQRVREGAVLICGVDLFRAYWVQPNYRFHALFEGCLRTLAFEPEVTLTEGDRPARGIELIVANPVDDGGLLIHLVNLRESQTPGVVTEWLPAVHDLRLKVRTPKPPASATLHPDELALDVRQGDGVVSIALPVLPIHACIEVRWE